jgi:hypothetical protein
MEEKNIEAIKVLIDRKVVYVHYSGVEPGDEYGLALRAFGRIVRDALLSGEPVSFIVRSSDGKVREIGEATAADYI